MHTGCNRTELSTPTPVTSLPLVCAVIPATQAERRCWVPKRPGGWEVTSSRGRCYLATAFRLHLLPRLLLVPIPGFTDFQALAEGDIGARSQPLGSQVVAGAGAQAALGGYRSGGPWGAEEPRGPRWVCAGLARAGSGAARSWGRGRHLAGLGNSGRWPALGMGLQRRARETATLMQPSVMQPGVEKSLCGLCVCLMAWENVTAVCG